MVQVSYTDNPGPTVTVENGKCFLFNNQLQVGGPDNTISYPRSELLRGFEPITRINARNCRSFLLQEGGPPHEGPTPDQGGPLDQRGPLDQGGQGVTPPSTGVDGLEGKGGKEVPPIEFEHVREIASLASLARSTTYQAGQPT